MANIKAFSCIRPRQDLAAEIAALPYDVYNRKEALEAVADKPYTFLRIDRPETQFPEDTDMYSEVVYQKAKELLEQMIAEGSYVADEENAYYVYQLIMNNKAQTGLVACASIDDYTEGIIKKHENTREEKELDRIRHVDTCNAQTGPIFLAYRSMEVIDNIVNAKIQETPLYSFVADDGVAHNVWKISDAKQVAQIADAFAQNKQIYIADGHHRAASAVKVGLQRRKAHPDYTGEEEFNFFLSVLFPHDQLQILPYNRVVRDLNGLSKEQFLETIQKEFTVQKSDVPVSPAEKGSFGMYLDNQWYTLTVHSEWLVEDPVEGLDASILQNALLSPVLGIADPRTDSRIDFVGGIRGLQELERRAKEDMMVAFSMYATSIEELFAVADAGKLMPPKSTWFEPKLRSRPFIHALERE